MTGTTISVGKIGYTAQITHEALYGQDFDLIRLSIEEAGGQTEIIYLMDYDIPQWSEDHKIAPRAS